MGYRSQVVFSVPASAPKFEQIENIFDEIIEKDNFRLYITNNAKWYDEFPVVDVIEDYIKANLDTCTFMRTGADLDDIEWSGSFGNFEDPNINPFDIHLERKIKYQKELPVRSQKAASKPTKKKK